MSLPDNEYRYQLVLPTTQNTAFGCCHHRPKREGQKREWLLMLSWLKGKHRMCRVGTPATKG
jgi:hypothetical protein